MLFHAGRTKVIAAAAYRHHQGVIRNAVLLRDQHAVFIDEGRHMHQALRPVQTVHLAQAVLEMVPMGLRQVVQLVASHVHAASGNFVQLGLPDMGAGFFDERDLGQAFARQGIAQAGG